MRPLIAPAGRHVLGRRATTLLTVLLTAVLVALSAAVPAAAVRSGPDVGVLARADLGGLARADLGVLPGPDAGELTTGTTGYVAPVAGVDPPSGVVRPFDAPDHEWGAGHRGVDLVAPEGSGVRSPGPGVVTFAGQVARRGVVVVTHPDGLRTSLEPVAASVPVGTAVAAGAAIGVVESSRADGGNTTPNHCAPRSCVHWGVRRAERYIDPLSLLNRPQIVLLPDPPTR
ncbi:peptidoglycan DD-metalloendopeptidase family protein [Promicromonospora sp. NPDC060271]|uniref:peptidoglycan DD-metalloendopeptidase family protein n=1 Tax=Promicromonospora sp. NPDC060271 TaxID=3347089 RepID=UPI00365CE148